jgi:hypothetical protein
MNSLGISSLCFLCACIASYDTVFAFLNASPMLLSMRCRQLYIGRGHQHPTTSLAEDEIVAFWTGVNVDGEMNGYDVPRVQFGRVIALQVVYSHNCENG